MSQEPNRSRSDDRRKLDGFEHKEQTRNEEEEEEEEDMPLDERMSSARSNNSSRMSRLAAARRYNDGRPSSRQSNSSSQEPDPSKYSVSQQSEPTRDPSKAQQQRQHSDPSKYSVSGQSDPTKIAQQQRRSPKKQPSGGDSQPPQQQHQQRSNARSPSPQQQQIPNNSAANRMIVPSASNLSASSSAVQQQQQQSISAESPLPPMVQRSLGDRSNEKRKNAALEIEALIKSLQETGNTNMIVSVITVLAKDFCTSMNSNYRKGGLIGLAATATGLMGVSSQYLHILLPPVLHCFDDPEARVRYYACESLYNIVKASRWSVIQYFPSIFEGLAKLYADVDVDVKNGANLLDRLLKDIVVESEQFHVEQFLPLLQTYIRRTNPFIRQLLVGWITLLDSIPDVSMVDYLPEYLDGLLNMLSDSNREIRQAADSALSEFLREVSVNSVVEFGPIVSILVAQCRSKERLNRLTAITWLAELIHHPYSGGDALLPYHAQVLGAILSCLSDGEAEIRVVAERTHDDLLTLVRDTSGDFELRPLLDTLMDELLGKEDVPTKMAALRWINMLLEKRQGDMVEYSEDLLPVLLRTLSDASDAVVLLNLQVLSRISLAQKEELEEAGETQVEEAQFQLVLNAILQLFATDRQLLETRGSLIIRKLCVLLNAKSVYIRMAEALSKYAEDEGVTKKNEVTDMASLEFVSTMVQTLNLILLTAAELHELRSALAATFEGHGSSPRRSIRNKERDGVKVFSALFNCWCHNPVSTFSLCLLAQAYDLSFALIKRFSELDVTVGFLMQVDKLVQLLESPIFVHVRLQLLDVEAEYHAPLLKALYGLLMLLPQSDAFRSLNDRLTTVCNLRDNLGISPTLEAEHDAAATPNSILSNRLLKRFDKVVDQHKKARARMEEEAMQKNEEVVANGGTNGETNSVTLMSSSAMSSMHSPASPGGRSDFSLNRRPLSPRSGVSQ